MEDRPHDVFHVFLADGSGSQGILNGRHEGVVDRIPSFGGVDAFGEDSIGPLKGFCFEGFDFIRHESIRAGPNPQCFTGFCDFQPLNDFRLTLVVQEQVPRLLGLGDILAIRAYLYQIPIAFFWG